MQVQDSKACKIYVISFSIQTWDLDLKKERKRQSEKSDFKCS